ncbi:MAG: TolC family protein [Phycisphaerales bacterium]|nr:MAG: TolC family protein [Phycisphaerales bacterium]
MFCSGLRIISLAVLVAGGVVLAGCAEWYAEDADREVYGVIDQRQEQAIGIRSDAYSGKPKGPPRVGSEGYAFAPHPVDPEVPEAFKRRADEAQIDAAEEARAATQPATASAPAEPVPQPLFMGFEDVIRYAFQNARDYQSRKEDLYLSALDLTLERHLWTPQFIAEVESNFVNYGQIRDFDRAMDTIANVAATQRLPLGGQVSAQLISTFMRDLGRHITSQESSELILSADIPLLRGAGRVALETRYQAERDLIYAVREFERQRRSFFVDVASDYFDLLVQRQVVKNAEFSVASFEEDYERAKALNEAGRVDILEVQRAEQNLLQSQNDVVNEQARFENLLDQFKIRIGMLVRERLELVEEDVDVPVPSVTVDEAIDTALRSRLDLITELDRVADAQRGVRVAANQLLPDLNLSGNVTFDTHPEKLGYYDFNEERATWRGNVTLGLPVDRKIERNEYRRSLIGLRRAERNYELQADTVRQEVRRAVRTFFEARRSLEIQELNIELATQWREAAAVKFELGLVNNLAKVDAENALRGARDQYAAALARYRVAVLAFRRDTETLRIEEDGMWVEMAGEGG